MAAPEWPTPHPAWKALVDRGARVVHTLDGHELRWSSATLPAPARRAEDSPRHEIVAHRCWEAVLDVFDLEPEWARSLTYLWPRFRPLVTTISQEAAGTVLAGLHEEFEAPAEALAQAFAAADLPDEPHRPGVVLPYAVAAVSATRARAGLLPRSLTRAEAVAPDMRLVSDLLAQARLLRLLAAQPDHPPTHPFTVYHVARAAWLTSVVLMAPETGDSDTANALLDEVTALQDLAKSLTEQLLAQSVLRGTREMDAVPLAYCAATLALPVNGDERYVEEALRHCTASQEERGAWTDGRMLVRHRDPDTGKPILLSSHEVALTIAECMSWTGIRRRVKQRFPAEASGSLVAALSYAEHSVVQVEDEHGNRIEGWRSSAAFGETSIEAVPTAAIVRLAVTARRVASLDRGARALEHFENVWDPSSGDHVPPYLEWKQYREENEPDSDNKILPDLHEWFVLKALKHRKTDIRPWAHPPAMSALLFGPPGTTKTTIVKAMAQGMGWPLVTLSPGTFIRDGLEHVEQRAIDVFAQLRDLSGVVVLFDECDELFRTRERTGDSESSDQTRSISAFMTASMLPKLQDLRDHGHVFFVIATNYFDQIDSAVKRLGRIDRMVGVGWPDKAQRRRIIRSELRNGDVLTALSAERRERAMEELADQSRFHIRGDIVHFAQALEARQGEFARLDDTDEFDERIGEITANVPEIARVHIRAFLDDAVSSSASHVKGRGELR